MLKTIKVNVVDGYEGLNKENYWIISLLKKHYNVEFSDQPDFLIYSCFGNEFESYKNCVKILYTGENIIPNFNECDYGVGFDYINFGDRYFRKSCYTPEKSINDRSDVNADLLNRRFCNFIYSNATSGEGAVLRQEFCKKLMEYKHVDCPGSILHNMDTDELAPRYGNWAQSKRDFLKKYKFTIAFENSSSDGYTTEKMFQPLEARSVPIYWGNPLVVRDVNPKAFINCNDYNNDFDAIIERIKYLDTHDDEYLAMLREQPMQPNYDFDVDKNFEQWLCNIIEKGNKPFNKDPRNWGTAPYKIKINKLTQENDKLNSKLIEVQNSIVTLDTTKLTNLKNELVEELNNESKTELEKFRFWTNNNFEHIKTEIKSKHKKQRKYFNLLLAVQALLLLLLLSFILI